MVMIIPMVIATMMINRGVHISMGKFQSGFLKKHIIFPGCILLPDYKNIRVEHFGPRKSDFWPFYFFGHFPIEIPIEAENVLPTWEGVELEKKQNVF